MLNKSKAEVDYIFLVLSSIHHKRALINLVINVLLLGSVLGQSVNKDTDWSILGRNKTETWGQGIARIGVRVNVKIKINSHIT